MGICICIGTKAVKLIAKKIPRSCVLIWGNYCRQGRHTVLYFWRWASCFLFFWILFAMEKCDSQAGGWWWWWWSLGLRIQISCKTSPILQNRIKWPPSFPCCPWIQIRNEGEESHVKTTVAFSMCATCKGKLVHQAEISLRATCSQKTGKLLAYRLHQSLVNLSCLPSCNCHHDGHRHDPLRAHRLKAESDLSLWPT